MYDVWSNGPTELLQLCFSQGGGSWGGGYSQKIVPGCLGFQVTQYSARLSFSSRQQVEEENEFTVEWTREV